jgi:NhaP-type Na+/H+ or K+/H+ antiporter
LLLGAILVVTGPTVVGPLLQQVRPKGKVGSALKWEGILIDPVGALLAVLMFEIILEGELHQAPLIIASGVLWKMVVGIVIGVLAAALLLLLLRRFLIPDHLQNGVSIMVVLLAFTGANLLQEESGLVAATLMGVMLANQSVVPVKHIEKFKENLRVLLIATLFILLAARLTWAEISSIGVEAFLFLAILIFVARPLSVFVSTLRSQLSLRERIFMSWMAPRGIVAAAISSIFAFRLIEDGMEGAEKLVPLTFLVIVGTVLIYSLTAEPLARFLKVSDVNPQGVLLMGANPLGREIARALQAEGVVTGLIDSNWQNISQARMAGLQTYYGNAYSEHTFEKIDFSGIGRFLALTRNEEANALASLHFAEIFGRAEVYNVATQRDETGDRRKKAPLHLSSRILFDEKYTYSYLSERIEAGSRIKATNITQNFNFTDYRLMHPEAIPLFVLRENTLLIFSSDEELTPLPGDLLFSLTPPSAAKQAAQSRKKKQRVEPVEPVYL